MVCWLLEDNSTQSSKLFPLIMGQMMFAKWNVLYQLMIIRKLWKLAHSKNTTTQCHGHPMICVFSFTGRITESLNAFGAISARYHSEYLICRTYVALQTPYFGWTLNAPSKNMCTPFNFKCNHNLTQIFWYPYWIRACIWEHIIRCS